jgi:secreted Zn-dependent insulinase-like peptidase
MFNRAILHKINSKKSYKHSFFSQRAMYAHPMLEEPLTDTRIYATIKLSNGIKAILVQDKTSEKAAAALSVQAGAMQDPSEYAGLAHFTGI